jgi:membrane dipeptidase
VATSANTMSRRHVLMTLTAAGGATLLGSALTRAALAQEAMDPRVAAIIANTITVDMHNHVGQPYFSETPTALTAAGAQAEALKIDLPGQIKRAGLTAVCLTAFVDLYLKAQPGEWYNYHLQIYDYIDKLLAASGLRRALTMADLEAAKASGTPTVIQSLEGAQWIEGKLGRIDETYERGTRHLQLFHHVHNLDGALGGIQQRLVPDGKTPVIADDHSTGLTQFGADVIRRCNRLGVVVDLAHADEATVLGALKISQQPLVVSHTALDTETARSLPKYLANPGLRARLVSNEYAKAVAKEGGIMGTWGLFPTMKEFVTGIKAMVDVVGVDHAGIGTDTVIAPPPFGSNISARQPATDAIWPGQSNGFLYRLANEMLAQGFDPGEISKIIGGNYCRVFKAVTATHAS